MTGPNGTQIITFFRDEDARKISLISPNLVFLPQSQAPSGKIYYRDNIDFMNNFYVDVVTRAFTDIEKRIADKDQKHNELEEKKKMSVLNSLKESWKNEMIADYEAQNEKIIEKSKQIYVDMNP